MQTKRRRRYKQTRRQKGGVNTYGSYTGNTNISYPKVINSFWSNSKRGFFTSRTQSAYLNNKVLPYITTLYKQLLADYETIYRIFRSNNNNDFNFDKFSADNYPNNHTPIGSNKYLEIYKRVSAMHDTCKIIEYVCTNVTSSPDYYTPEQKEQICRMSNEAKIYLRLAISVLQESNTWEQDSPPASSGMGNYNIPNPYSGKNGSHPINNLK
jgi:hypothetical protein